MSTVIIKSGIDKQGGLEKYTYRIAQAFIDRKKPVIILTTKPKRPLLENSYLSYEWTEVSSFFSFRRIELFDRYCSAWQKTHNPKYVLSLDRNREQTHIRAGNGVHKAFLESRKWTDPFWKTLCHPYNPLNRKILEIEKTAFTSPKLQKIFVNSNMVKNELQYYYNLDSQKIVVLHNAVEWHEMENDFLQWPFVKESLLKKLQIPTGCYHLLFVGHGFDRKGLKPLLIALSHVTSTPFHLSIVGKDKKISEYKTLVTKLHLEDKVTFFGPQKNIRPFYQIADALVIPSFYDPFANVTVEALAMGLYVVSSTSNGGHEILTKENGNIIENLLDTSSLLYSLEQAFKHPKNQESSTAIRKSVKELEFSSQMDKLLQFFI
jgi:UDP-glucose:(heptosyl)LPS alpha-1,3-glucosyltransferase